MTESALYRLEDVQKSNGRGWRLSIDALDIPHGGVFAIVGPNGAGKSTLLRLLHFLEPADSGSIAFEGMAVGYPAPAEIMRSISMVFQRPIMLSGTVERNVTLGLRLRGRRGLERAGELIEELGLGDLAQAAAGELSGGEAQRVALARALAVRPKALLLDEPTANLDPYTVQQIESIIRSTAEDPRLTVVLVTHHIFQAKRIADRVAMMADGRILEVADRETFFNSPQDHRTAAFLRGELIC